MTALILILIVIVILVSIWLNTVSSKLGIPALLAFMLLGMLFANNGLWAIRFDNYGFAKETCTVALIFIMFYGGFGTRWEAVRPVVRESVLLASVGVMITATLTGVFCHYVFKWTWLESLLFGSVMGSTDAASIVFAIMAMVHPAFLENDIFNIVFVVVLLSISIQGSFIPLVARKLDMADPNADVMKTFNDYADDTGMNFGRLAITPDSSWAGRAIKDLDLPGNVLIALVVRDNERIKSQGNTILKPGDEVIILTRGFTDASTSLEEKTVKSNSRRVGQRIEDYPGKGLIVMVRRGKKNIIPNGRTVLKAGDRLVILNL